MDYVDHVDEQTLHDSFEKFVERIDFKILGLGFKFCKYMNSRKRKPGADLSD